MFRAKATAEPTGTTSRCSRARSCSTGSRWRGCWRKMWTPPAAAPVAPLPAILTIEQAIAANSFLSETFALASGDMSAMRSSALQFDGELRIGGQEHFYLETQASIAWMDESGGVAVHASTQHPAETQEIVARALGVARHRVSVACLRMGGAFGGKEVQANAWAAIAALGAWKTGRPV